MDAPAAYLPDRHSSFAHLTPHTERPFGMKIFAREGPSGTELTIGVRTTPFRVQQGLQIIPKVGIRDGALTIRLNRSPGAEHIAQPNEKIHKFSKVIQYLGLAILAAISLLLGPKIQPHFGAHLIFALHFHRFIYILTGVVTFLPVPARSRHIPLDRPLASDRIWP